jgi:hypothetical protein
MGTPALEWILSIKTKQRVTVSLAQHGKPRRPITEIFAFIPCTDSDVFASIQPKSYHVDC